MRNPMIGVVGLVHGGCVNSVTCLAINSNFDTIVTGSDEGLIVLWQAQMLRRIDSDGLKDFAIKIFPTSISVTSRFPATTPILDVCFVASPLPNTHLGIRENLASLHGDNSICIWSMIDARCIARVNSTFKLDRLAVLADRRFLAAFGQGIHILDTWNLEIIANLHTVQPILDLACTQHPQLHSVTAWPKQKQLICAITNGELNCWDVTDSCKTKHSPLSKTEYTLNCELSDTQAQLNDYNNTINKVKIPLISVSINNKTGKIGLKNQICVSTNLIFAISGPRITVWITSNSNNELYPLMDFLNPDINNNSNFTSNSNWLYIQLIDLSKLQNLSGNDDMYCNFMETYKTALVACNDQNKVYCYILPEHTSIYDEYTRFHSLVKATYVGEFTKNVYNPTTVPIFITRGFITNCIVKNDGYENCCLNFTAILANSQGIFVQHFIKIVDGINDMDYGLEMVYSMENILPKPPSSVIKLSAMATFKVNNSSYIAYCLANGSVCCIGRNGIIKLQSPKTLLDFVTTNNKITLRHRILYHFHTKCTSNDLNPVSNGSTAYVKHILSVNDHLILTDSYTTCVYKFSDEIYPVFLTSGWHAHKIASVHPVIVPMGSLIRQSLDHFATVDFSGRIIIWYLLSSNTCLTYYGELPSSHYMLERAGVRNIHKIVLDEARSLAIIITLKRVLIWSLETKSLISNESKWKYITFFRSKNKSGSTSNVTDPFTSLVPQIKRVVYGSNINIDGSNYRGSSKNGFKFSVPRYHNVLFCKDLFKDESLNSGGGITCANLQLKGRGNRLTRLSIIASTITSQMAWLVSLETFPVKFLPCTLGGFWITMHLTLSIAQRYKEKCEQRRILETPDIRLSIYSVRSSHLCNLLDLSHTPYNLYKTTKEYFGKLYNTVQLGPDIDRIWLLGHYVLIGSLPGQTIDLIIMGRKAEHLLRKLFSSFNDTLSVHAMALLLGIIMTTRFYIQKLKVLSYPPSIYVIDKWTYNYLLTHKIQDKLLVSDMEKMEIITITEEDAENLKKLPRTDSFRSKKTISTGALHAGLTPQFPITDLACMLLSILVYEKPVIASNTFAYIDNPATTFGSPCDTGNSNRVFLGEEIFIIAVRLLGCKIFCYTECFNRLPPTIPPFNGFVKINHMELFTRLLTCLFPLLPFGSCGGLAGNIVNNVMLGYPHTIIGIKNEFKRIITASAIHSPDTLSNSLHFAQLSSHFVAEIIHHLLAHDLIRPETLHLYAYYIVTTLTTGKEIKKFLFGFPMISLHGDVIAFGYTNGNIHLYNTCNGQLIKELFAHDSAVACLVLDSSGENIAAYQHQEPALHVWKVSSYNFFKSFTASTSMHRKLELKRLQGDFNEGLEGVKIQFKSKDEWFLHREDGRAYIVRG